MSVDNRIVKMTFDNASFQKKTAETMSSLEKLKSSLNFNKGIDGVKNLSSAFSKLDLRPVSTSIDKVNQGVVASTAIATAAIFNLTNRVVNAGLQMANALTIKPVVAGFQEYETNMNSIQTILANTASKGTSLEQVNGALDQMNQYSDKTIYNFGQMARNVGTFTAAGVDLETSVNSIKGIANLAAVSGSSSEQASTAMYQLSQAIAAGSVKLMDWNSVVNAGMGGEVFKNALVQTGQALGTIAKQPVGQSFKEWEAANGSFRESLQDGWVTAEVLTTTLGAISGDLDAIELSKMGFTDDQVVDMIALGKNAVAAATEVKTLTQLASTVNESIASGWSQTFRLIVGDFKEAKTLFTGLNDFFGTFIGGAADARNKLLTEWKFIGGRDVLMIGFIQALAALKAALSPIAKAFREVFPRTTALELAQLTHNFSNFTRNLIISESTAKTVKQVFKGLFSIFKIGVEVLKGLFSVASTLVKVFFSLVGAFAGAAGTSGDFISKITDILVGGGLIAKVFGFVNSVLLKLGDGILWVRDRLSDLTQFFTGGVVGEKFGQVFEQLGGVFDVLRQSLGGIVQALKPAGAAIGKFFSIITRAGGAAGGAAGGGIITVFSGIADALLSFTTFITSIISKIGSKAIPFLLNVSENIGLFFYKLNSAISNAGGLFGVLSKVGDSISGFFTSLYKGFMGTDIGATVENTFNTIKNFFVSLYNTITGVDVGGAASGALAEINGFFDSLWARVSGLGALSQALDGIKNSISGFFSSIFNTTKSAGPGITSSLENVGESIGKFVGNIGSAFASGFSSIGQVFKNAFSSILDGLGNVGDGISKAIDNFIEKIKGQLTAKNIGTVLISIITASFARIAFGGLKFDFGIGGLVDSISGVLDNFGGIIQNFKDILDNVGGAIKSFQNNLRADTLMKVAIAMGVLTLSIIALSFIDADRIAISLGAVAAGIGTIVAAMAILLKLDATSAKVIGIGIAINLVAAAVLVLAAAIFVFSKMDPDTFTTGMIRVGIVLGTLAVLAVALSKAQGSFIRAAISLGIFAGSLILFAQTIKYYSEIPFDALLKGSFTIAAILGVFAFISNFMDGTEIVKFSVGLGLASFALSALAKVVEKFGNMPFEVLRNGLGAMVIILGVLIGTMLLMPDKDKSKASTVALLGMSVALLIMSKAIETIGKMGLAGALQGVLSLVVLLGLLVGAAILLDKFGGNGVTMMLAIAGAVVIFAAAIALLGQLDVGQVLTALGAIAGLFLVIGVAMLLLQPVIPILYAFGIAMLVTGAGFALFGVGLLATAYGLQLLGKVGPKAIKNLSKVFLEIIKLIPKLAAALAEGLVEFVKVIAKSAGEIADAIGDLAIKLFEKLEEIIPVIGEVIGVLLETLLTLIEEKVPRFIEVGLTILTAFLTGIRDNIEQIVTLGLEILTNFINGLVEGIPKLGESIRNLIVVIVEEFVKNVRLLIAAGVFVLTSILDGIADAIPDIAKAVTDVITTFIEEVGKNALLIALTGYNTLVAFLKGITGNTKYVLEQVRIMVVQIIDSLNELLFGDGKEKQGIVDAAIEFVQTFLTNMTNRAIRFAFYLGKLLVTLLNGLADAVEKYSPLIRDAAKRLGFAIIDGMTLGLASKAQEAYDKISEIAGGVIERAFGLFVSNSPSKVFRDLGLSAVDGLTIGLSDGSSAVKASKGLASSTIKAFGEAMSGLSYDLSSMEEFNPTITPVLDLTRLNKDAQGISTAFGSSSVSATLSAGQARSLSLAQANSRTSQEASVASGPTEIKFEQIINSPVALSTEDIYRNTRSQITLAKEELGIL